MSISSRLRTAGVAVAVAGAAVATPLLLASPALAIAGGGGNESLQFCRSIQAFYTPDNIIGPCTSYFQSHLMSSGEPAAAAATAAYFCRYYTLIGTGGDFPTVGSCIAATKPFA